MCDERWHTSKERRSSLTSHSPRMANVPQTTSNRTDTGRQAVHENYEMRSLTMNCRIYLLFEMRVPPFATLAKVLLIHSCQCSSSVFQFLLQFFKLQFTVASFTAVSLVSNCFDFSSLSINNIVAVQSDRKTRERQDRRRRNRPRTRRGIHSWLTLSLSSRGESSESLILVGSDAIRNKAH